MIAVGNDGQFARLCTAVGSPALAAEPGPPRPGVHAPPRCAPPAARGGAGRAFRTPVARRADSHRRALRAHPRRRRNVRLGRWPGPGPARADRSDGTRMPGVRHPITFSSTPASSPLAPSAPDSDRKWLAELLGRAAPGVACSRRGAMYSPIPHALSADSAVPRRDRGYSTQNEREPDTARATPDARILQSGRHPVA